MPVWTARCRNQDPGCVSMGAIQRGTSWATIPKTLNRARTVHAPCAHRATTPPNSGPVCEGRGLTFALLLLCAPWVPWVSQASDPHIHAGRGSFWRLSFVVVGGPSRVLGVRGTFRPFTEIMLARRARQPNFSPIFRIFCPHVGDTSHVPPVPSIEHCKREQYSSITGGNFGRFPARCVRYASVGSLPPF